MTIYRKSTRRKIPPKAVQGAVTSSPKFHFPPHKNHFTISTFFLSLHPTELRVVCENKTPARLNPDANRIDHKDSAFRAVATSLSSLITSLKRENQWNEVPSYLIASTWPITCGCQLHGSRNSYFFLLWSLLDVSIPNMVRHLHRSTFLRTSEKNWTIAWGRSWDWWPCRP